MMEQFHILLSRCLSCVLSRSVVSNSLDVRDRLCQAPLSMGFSRQEYWNGLPCPPPGDLPNPGMEPWSPTLQEGSSPSEPPGKPIMVAAQIWTSDNVAQNYTYTCICTHTFTSVCQTDGIRISSVHCANVKSLAFYILWYLSKMLSLEETGWKVCGTSMYIFATSCESVIISK